MSKMIAYVRWEGARLTLGDLREIVDRTRLEPDGATVHVTKHDDQRDGTNITLRVTLLSADLPERTVQT